uniref:Uncharacterized protein n=1 Tax=Clytia hemisphaerica TaxID=252671 RepID=A0A7M5XGA8_9CNID
MSSSAHGRFDPSFNLPSIKTWLRGANITPKKQHKHQEKGLEMNDEKKGRENVQRVNQVYSEESKDTPQRSLETSEAADSKRRENQNPLDPFWIEAGKSGNLSNTTDQECKIFQKCLNPLLLLMKVSGLYFDDIGRYKIFNRLSKIYCLANNVFIILIFISTCADIYMSDSLVQYYMRSVNLLCLMKSAIQVTIIMRLCQKKFLWKFIEQLESFIVD